MSVHFLWLVISRLSASLGDLSSSGHHVYNSDGVFWLRMARKNFDLTLGPELENLFLP